MVQEWVKWTEVEWRKKIKGKSGKEKLGRACFPKVDKAELTERRASGSGEPH